MPGLEILLLLAHRDLASRIHVRNAAESGQARKPFRPHTEADEAGDAHAQPERARAPGDAEQHERIDLHVVALSWTFAPCF
jgi:hypothetical protein